MPAANATSIGTSSNASTTSNETAPSSSRKLLIEHKQSKTDNGGGNSNHDKQGSGKASSPNGPSATGHPQHPLPPHQRDPRVVKSTHCVRAYP